MKILITGAKGQLGSELTDVIEKGFSDIGEIDSAYKDAELTLTGIDELDITDHDAVEEYILAGGFDYVINCAGMTNVDACERFSQEAFEINALGPKNLAQACQLSNSVLVHISTDYVLKGLSSCPQDEDAPCKPQSVYGSSKLAGEIGVIENCNRYFIFRTAWLYGKKGDNFVKTILRIAQENSSITVVNDQMGSPTNANDLAYEMVKVILTENYGIYNCTGNDFCTWFDFACEIVANASIDCDVRPCTTDEFPRAAKRPVFSILDNKHLRDTVGDDMRVWREALWAFMEGE
ncbi:MAG: dTDP-4-dehydrorhamnose reductase [Solibacillus sp.]